MSTSIDAARHDAARHDAWGGLSYVATLAGFGLLSAFQFSIGMIYAGTPAAAEKISVAAPAVSQGVKIDVPSITNLTASGVTFVLGLVFARYNHIGKMARTEIDKIDVQRQRDLAERMLVVETRMKMIDKGYACELAGCPVIGAASGETPLEAVAFVRKGGEIKLPQGFPLGTPTKEAEPDEDTKDLP